MLQCLSCAACRVKFFDLTSIYKRRCVCDLNARITRAKVVIYDRTRKKKITARQQQWDNFYRRFHHPFAFVSTTCDAKR